MGSFPHIFTSSRSLMSSPGLACRDPNTVQQCLLLPDSMADTGPWEGLFLMESASTSSSPALGIDPARTFSPFGYNRLYSLHCSSPSVRISFSLVPEPPYDEAISHSSFQFFLSHPHFPTHPSSPHREQATQDSQCLNSRTR